MQAAEGGCRAGCSAASSTPFRTGSSCAGGQPSNRTRRAFAYWCRQLCFRRQFFLTSEFFAAFIDRLDLAGLRVADVGTGSGILALAAARAGASSVTAIDINPNAARAAHQNAQSNGFGDVLSGVCSHLMSGLAARPLFDVILSSPPSFSGEPLDLADRAWHSGADNRHIAELFEQTRERLHPRGRMYLLLSSDSDLAQIGALIARQSFQVLCVAARSIFFESFFLYELTRPNRNPHEAAS
jgi:release factor glutamine methyltransferase